MQHDGVIVRKELADILIDSMTQLRSKKIEEINRRRRNKVRKLWMALTRKLKVKRMVTDEYTREGRGGVLGIGGVIGSEGGAAERGRREGGERKRERKKGTRDGGKPPRAKRRKFSRFDSDRESLSEDSESEQLIEEEAKNSTELILENEREEEDGAGLGANIEKDAEKKIVPQDVKKKKKKKKKKKRDREKEGKEGTRKVRDMVRARLISTGPHHVHRFREHGEREDGKVVKICIDCGFTFEMEEF